MRMTERSIQALWKSLQRKRLNLFLSCGSVARTYDRALRPTTAHDMDSKDTLTLKSGAKSRWALPLHTLIKSCNGRRLILQPGSR